MAKIQVIVDEWNYQDARSGILLSGPPGKKLKEWVQDAGIHWSDIRCCTLDNFNRCADTVLFIPIGDKALQSLLPDSPKLSKVRGSIYNFNDEIKIIPTLHPEIVTGTFDRGYKNGQAIMEHRCRMDWIKIAKELENGKFEAPIRNHNIAPDISDIESFIEGIRCDSIISMDIETWGGSIKCIGFAASGRESIVIPTEKHYWTKRTGIELDLDTAWDCIREMCEHPAAKVMQNGLFDAWWLDYYGIKVNNYVWDTLAMHHAIHPRDNHSLDYLASIYTNQPYWKDEAKEADEIVRIANKGMDKLYVYNGLDVTVTWEIFEALKSELEETGMLGFYHRHYAGLFEPLLSLMRTGICVHRENMDELRVSLLGDALRLRDQASQLAGRPLYTFDKTKCERDMLTAILAGSDPVEYAKEQGHKEDTIARKSAELADKGISDKVLIEVFEGLELPKAATGATKTGRVKVDNIALRKIQKYYEERKKENDKGNTVRELVDITLEHRRKRKLASFLTESKIDEDNRLRCTYKFTTKTGRLSSSKNPLGSGMNLQNIDRELRHLFIASPGRILIEVDLSQAEARVVGALTGDEEMIRIARRLPTEGDTHTENAQIIYSALWKREVAPEEVTKEMRYLGKRAVHASGYGMTGNKLSDILLKEGFAYTGPECQKLIDAYMEQRPAIRTWQRDTRYAIRNKRYLQTSWGRYVTFEYDEMNDEIYRFGYCYVPQSEIGDLTNNWMVKTVYNAIKKNKLKSQLLMQVHDAIIIDAVPEEAYDLMSYVKRCVERPRIYGQTFGRSVELVVPCEYGIGRTWKKTIEWKELPEKEELDKKIKELLSE